MKTLPSTDVVHSAVKQKVDELLSLEKIYVKDIEGFTQPERRLLEQTASKILNRLKGDERDRFLNKIDQLLPADTKNVFWEHNHGIISSAISAYIADYGVMPTKSAIAKETGLSRQTVAKHFKEYRAHPEFLGRKEQFKFISDKVLATVVKYANNGDMKAARLYFEMIGAINKKQGGTVVNEQNNFIQINNTILSQEKLKELSPRQLEQIEQIVANRAYQPMP